MTGFSIDPTEVGLYRESGLHGIRSAGLGLRALRAVGMVPAIMLLLCASLLPALETPSKPFLDKNSFYLSSAGFSPIG
jgi:hypothetical protein